MQATRHYVYDVNILIAAYGLVLGTNYMVGFILLIIIYTKLLRYIKKMRAEFGKLTANHALGLLTHCLAVSLSSSVVSP